MESGNYLESFSSKSEVLTKLDEYSLYCHYLGYAPAIKLGRYHSPVRTNDNQDDKPSFGVFYSRKRDVEFFWKDLATGESGDIFKLVMLIYGYRNSLEAITHVLVEFGLIPGSLKAAVLTVVEPTKVVPIKISINPRAFTQSELEYWLKYNITQRQLARYNVSAVGFYWMYEGQDVPKFAAPMTFAYRIRDRFKIYRPFGKPEEKFRTDYDDTCIEGLAQLEYRSDTLIITKATKDVMCLDSLGFDAIAPRSENIPLRENLDDVNKLISGLRKRGYKRFVTLFDNDGKHRTDFHPYAESHLTVPIETGCKDPSDHCDMYGPIETKTLINHLLNAA